MGGCAKPKGVAEEVHVSGRVSGNMIAGREWVHSTLTPGTVSRTYVFTCRLSL